MRTRLACGGAPTEGRHGAWSIPNRRRSKASKWLPITRMKTSLLILIRWGRSQLSRLIREIQKCYLQRQDRKIVRRFLFRVMPDKAGPSKLICRTPLGAYGLTRNRRPIRGRYFLVACAHWQYLLEGVYGSFLFPKKPMTSR